MKTKRYTSTIIAAFTLGFLPAIGSAQIVNFDNNNNSFVQASNGASVRGRTLNFLGGNDRLVLARNDDLAGLGSGTANMGEGRDVVLTSFNMSGTFNLGGGDDFFGSEGDVNFNGNALDIRVLAGLGNDLIFVRTENCEYFGEQGNDIFVSDGSNNRFNGGDGSDTYSAEAAESGATIDLLQGGAQARFNLSFETLSSIENARGSDFGDTIFGDSNWNRLDGLQGDDFIDGDPGNDTISGGAGTNTLEGNTGIDTLVIQGTVTSKTRIPGGIRVVGALSGVVFTHTATGFEQVLENNVLKSVAFFMGETAVNVVQQTVIAESPVEAAINGFIAGQTLNGTAVANTINGGVGADDIAGLAGNDTLNGNAGDDVILGGDGVDTINGGDNNDLLDGGAHNDTINGGLGNDRIVGGLGLDRLTGGGDSDVFVFATAFAGSADTITDYNVAQDTIQISRALVGNLAAGELPASRFKNTATGALDADDRIIYNSANGQLLFDSNGSAAGGSVLIATLPANIAMVAAEIVLF